MALSYLVEIILNLEEFVSKKESELKEEIQWRTFTLSALLPFPDINCPSNLRAQIKENFRATMWAIIWYLIYVNILKNPIW